MKNKSKQLNISYRILFTRPHMKKFQFLDYFSHSEKILGYDNIMLCVFCVRVCECELQSYFHCRACCPVLMTQGMTLWQQMGASQYTPVNILLSATKTKLMHKTVTCESHWCLFAWGHKTRYIKFPRNHVMWHEDSPLLLSLCSKVI